MAKIMEVYSGEGKVFEAFVFFCPACKCGHAFLQQTEDGHQHWNGSWNEDFEHPTLNPSYLTWCKNKRCHSYVVDGCIHYLDDCEHELKGQKVELPDFNKM